MSLLLALIAAAAPLPSTEPTLCRWVHGRIGAGNGTPSVRIWVIGTKRMLGVATALEQDWPTLPANLDALWNKAPASTLHRRIHGNFRVCAWKPQRPGVMQQVRVVAARQLVAVDDPG